MSSRRAVDEKLVAMRKAQGQPAPPAWNGTPYWAYGGDFGDEPHDGNFCINGMLECQGGPQLQPGLVDTHPEDIGIGTGNARQ